MDWVYKLIQLRNNHHGCGYIKVLDQIKERLAQGHIPLIVFEGESDNKLRSISSSIYLRHCFDILSQSEGKLLIFGVSFENDQHIINAISKSKISDIFIGVYDEDDRIMYQDKFSSCDKKIHYFSSKEVPFVSGHI